MKHTTIEVKEILVTDGNITSKDLPPIIMLGDVSMERANVLARKEHKEKQVAVTGVSTETKTYFMTLEDFIKYASEVTEDEEMKENGGNE